MDEKLHLFWNFCLFSPTLDSCLRKIDQKMSSSRKLSYVRIVSELLPLRVTYDAASASQLLCTIEKWFLQDDKRLI